MKDAAPAHRPVIVAGSGQSGPLLEDVRSIPEIVHETVESALADAHITHEDIDAVVTASVDLFDGLTASNVAVTEVVGAVMKPETRISADGLGAVIHAACQIWAGAYDTVLVVAHGKASMAPHWDLTQWAMDPVYLQPLGVDFLTCAGLQARVLAAADPKAEERWAEVAVNRRGQAANSLIPPGTVAEVLDSAMVASPLRAGMCAPLGDGACAIVLRAADKQEKDAVYLSGVGYDLGPHSPGQGDLSVWAGLRRACGRAYAQGQIEDPSTAFDLAEPSALFPHEEELFIQASGIGGETVVSPGGGLFGGTAPVIGGLSRLIAAHSFLKASATAGRALAHGAWGPAGQGQAVALLEGGGS